MRVCTRSVVTFAAIASLCSAAAASPAVVNGASFDAPIGCSASERAVVCKVDGQQLELWVNRKLVAEYLQPDEPFAQKMTWFQGLHETAVGNIMRSTFNDKRSGFSTYGNYPALGTALPGKGSPSSPAVRFASVLYEDSYWEFLEVATARSPVIEGLSGALERSLQLPKADPAKQPALSRPGSALAAAAEAPSTAATPRVIAALSAPALPDAGASPLSTTFKAAVFSFDHPGYMTAKVATDQAGEFTVQLTHKSRKVGGPTVSVRWQMPGPGISVAAQAVALRDEQISAFNRAPQTASLSRFGGLPGQGFALLGVLKPSEGSVPTETLRTLFVADINGGRLEVRLAAEQAYGDEAQTVWAMIAQTLALKP